MLKNLARAWFGDFTWPELKKYLMLSFIFFFTIGVYWMLRVTKDSVFDTVIGLEHVWIAKIVSVIVVFPLVMIYNFLADRFPRHRLFYVLSAIYASLMVLFYFLLMNPNYGLNSSLEPSKWRMLGWSYYVTIESFGSIMVALFWSFAADVATPQSAKRGYFLVAMGGQIGAILGTVLLWRYASQFGTQAFLLGGAVAIGAIALFVRIMRAIIPEEETAKYQGSEAGAKATDKKEKPKKTGIVDSIKMVLAYPYLLAIFGVISFFEIIVTVFDYRFKNIAKMSYTGDELSSYFGYYGILVNVVAFISLVGGIGNIGRRLGLKVSLSLLPVIIAAAALTMYNPTLTTALVVMVVSKAINYALNQPAKEQLYIPTTYEAKYKSKAFMEMFGSRSSKGLGSLINGYLPGAYFALASTVMALGVSGVWLLVALYLGNKHKKAVENNEVVC